jgi:hypothetical protein
MRRGALVLAILVTCAGAAGAEPPVVHRQDVQGRIHGVRAVTAGTGRRYAVALVQPRDSTEPLALILTLNDPREPPGFPAVVTKISSWSEGGPVAFLRRKKQDFMEIRSVGGLARSPGTAPVFWDAVTDLDGDGDEELLYPLADGRMSIDGEPIDAPVASEVMRNDADLFQRDAKIPTMQPADLDGDGKKELVALVGTDLVVWSRGGDGKFARSGKAAIPFLAPDPKRPPVEIRTPRINVVDVDADGRADLLVTLVHGRADKVGDLRTSLYRFPGPFFDAKTGALVEPQARIDTESVALHPRFVDVDGDGKLDYVADSIRGSTMDLIARVLGQEPTIWHTIFRFDAKAGAYEKKPWADVQRPYSSDEAKGNTFGRSGFFEGDFDGDGVKDLLDLGNLTGVTILAGTKSGEGAFTREILPHTKFDKSLRADAVITDLDGDGRSDAVLWTDDGHLVVIAGAPKKTGK